MAQNHKKLCLLRSIYQEPYVIWFSCMVHICKMIISPSVFSIFFQEFDFSGCCSGGKSAKKGPKWQEILFVLFFMCKLQPPLKKVTPLSPSNPSLKVEVQSRPPFWKFGWRFNPLPPAEKGAGVGCTICVAGQKGIKWSKMTKYYIRFAPYLRNHTLYDCHLWCTYVKW